MLLKNIHFHNFRNFEQESFNFNPFLTVVIGENARGKTNLLEGSHFLITGQGFREEKEEELIYLGQNDCFVEGAFNLGDDNFQFRIVLLKNQVGVEKSFFVNKTHKKHFQYLAEQTKTVLFAPEQIEIITGPPSVRRDYFNRLISSYDLEYKKRLVNYDNALRKRNKILETHRDVVQLQEELVFWDEYLVTQAEYITRAREEYANFLNQHQKLDAKVFYIVYNRNEFTSSRLANVFEEEKRFRRTVIGPQKDDFRIFLKGNPPAGDDKDVHHYGSRSEQRMAVFWLKMNEIHWYVDTKKKKPILLLDDVFSELDLHNRKIVLDLVKKYQTILTTTEPEILELTEVPKTVIKL